jgi:hypothetical protein
MTRSHGYDQVVSAGLALLRSHDVRPPTYVEEVAQRQELGDGMDQDVIAYKLVAVDRNGAVASTQYVSPRARRYAAKLLLEEGWDVAEQPLSEMPDGVGLDVE